MDLFIRLSSTLLWMVKVEIKKSICSLTLKVLYWYCKDRPYFHLEGYMNRYWIIPYKRNRFDIAIRLHQILRSDLDRNLHDHPWSFISIILKGGYYEIRENSLQGTYREVIKYDTGSIRYHNNESFHKLILNDNQECWTLFITFKKKQGWGFKVWDKTKNQYVKIPWRQYENTRHQANFSQTN